MLDRIALAVAVASEVLGRLAPTEDEQDGYTMLIPWDWAIDKKSTLYPSVVPYLNERSLQCRPRLVKWSAHDPQVTMDLGGEEPTLEQLAVTSFLLFLEELTLSRESGGGRLGLRKCPVCGNLFVQEAVGRTKRYCMARCKFRARRKVLEKARRKEEAKKRRKEGRR
jgi:hypothetical protein